MPLLLSSSKITMTTVRRAQQENKTAASELKGMAIAQMKYNWLNSISKTRRNGLDNSKELLWNHGGDPGKGMGGGEGERFHLRQANPDTNMLVVNQFEFL